MVWIRDYLTCIHFSTSCFFLHLWLMYCFFFVCIFLTEVEQSKQVKGVTNLDNPSEIIKNAQRELVMNNSSTKEENKKG